MSLQGPAPSLLAQQLFLQAYIRSPGDEAQALEAAARISGLDLGCIVPTPRQDPLQRLDCYRGQYLARIGEVLATEYPGVRASLGEARFRALVAAYLTAHPPTHPSLHRLGDHLAAFLVGFPSPRRAFTAEVAKLEAAISEVMDVFLVPALQPAALLAVRTEAWFDLQLRPSPALRLLTLSYPLSAWLTAVHSSDTCPPLPPRGRSHVVVYREEMRTCRRVLDGQQMRLLHSLCASRSLGESLARHPSLGRRAAEVAEWFVEWVSLGWFAAPSGVAEESGEDFWN